MKYTYKKKVYDIPDKEIDKAVDKFDISIAEACELWLTDNNKITNTEIENMSKNKVRRYEKSDKPRKASTKERKIDTTKERFILDIKVLLEGLGATILKVKTETEINFIFNNENYTVKIIKHRKK